MTPTVHSWLLVDVYISFEYTFNETLKEIGYHYTFENGIFYDGLYLNKEGIYCNNVNSIPFYVPVDETDFESLNLEWDVNSLFYKLFPLLHSSSTNESDVVTSSSTALPPDAQRQPNDKNIITGIPNELPYIILYIFKNISPDNLTVYVKNTDDEYHTYHKTLLSNINVENVYLIKEEYEKQCEIKYDISNKDSKSLEDIKLLDDEDKLTIHKMEILKHEKKTQKRVYRTQFTYNTKAYNVDFKIIDMLKIKDTTKYELILKITNVREKHFKYKIVLNTLQDI